MSLECDLRSTGKIVLHIVKMDRVIKSCAYWNDLGNTFMTQVEANSKEGDFMRSVFENMIV